MDGRHTYVSMLIGAGMDALYVARQAGHGSVKETLDRYSHLFDRVVHADKARAALEAHYGSVMEAQTLSEESPLVPEPEAEVVDMQAFRSGGN